jgi:UDP-N-acetylmuramoyl-L-alanyl-D-glutamate--2,6-diaminopimelate ligase
MNNVLIQNIRLDSRQVMPGDLFIATRGLTVDGRDYIVAAVEQGAAAILVEADGNYSLGWMQNTRGEKIPLIPVSHLKTLVGDMAARFFDEPAKKLSVIGITGTNGKTSTSHYIAALLKAAGHACGIVGTLGAGFLNALEETGHTTPDAISTQQKLFQLVQQGATVVAIEVTSHALSQQRLNGMQFQTAIFTNLTRDHLDYHRDLSDYWLEKQKLFLDFKPQNIVLNLDDAYGKQLSDNTDLRKNAKNIVGFTLEDRCNTTLSAIMMVKKARCDQSGITAVIETPWGSGEFKTALVGKFNLSNLVAAIAAVCLEGVSFETVLEAIPSLASVSGRMMRLGGQDSLPLVLVDYAHTPDALMQVLEAVRMHCQGKIWCVFGCGGDRDRGKRPLMANIAEQLSDYVYVTQDNPRTEAPEQIIQDILAGFKNREKVTVELDRSQAIQAAIALASQEDCVVVAGKGHEPYQIIGTEKKSFLDQREVEMALQRRASCKH